MWAGLGHVMGDPLAVCNHSVAIDRRRAARNMLTPRIWRILILKSAETPVYLCTMTVNTRQPLWRFLHIHGKVGSTPDVFLNQTFLLT